MTIDFLGLWVAACAIVNPTVNILSECCENIYTTTTPHKSIRPFHCGGSGERDKFVFFVAP